MKSNSVWRIVAFMRGTPGSKWTVLQLSYALAISIEDVSVCVRDKSKFVCTKLGKDNYYSLKAGGKNATNKVRSTHTKK